MISRGFAVLLLMISGGNAAADVVATCGESKGHAYYLQGPIVPASKAGWTEDGVSGGSFQLIRSGDDWDIVFTDVSGGTVSSKGDGGTTAGEVTADGDIVVFISYPKGVFETWVFWLSNKNPTASYSQAKFSTGIRKHSLMVAPCRRGA